MVRCDTINFVELNNLEHYLNTNVNGKRSQLKYDSEVFEALLETINLTDARLSNVWGNI
jgi:hypothetical protein